MSKVKKKTKKIYLFAALLLLPSIALLLFFILKSNIAENKKEGIFSQKTNSLSLAKDAEIIDLTNGETFDLEASYVVKEIGNRKVRMLAYNGSIPGPFIRVEQGGEITINFTNNTDIETTIHSHGIRIDFPFDGTPGISQKAIQPGETFVYKVKFPDGGTYWYHPHVREDYAQELGLYGNYIVNPTQYAVSQVHEELNVIVDDVLFEGDEMPPFYKDRTNFAIMGRFGNVMLVNGQTDYEKTFPAGSVVRLNLTNVANARPFEISIPGAKMKLVGSDLSPYEQEQFIEHILITPSERYIVDVYFEKAGNYEMITTSHDRTIGDKKYDLANFIVTENAAEQDLSESFLTLHEHKHVTEEAKQFDEYLFKRPDKSIRLSLDPGELDLTSGMESLPCHRMPDGTWMGQCTEESKQAWLEGLSEEETVLGGEKIHWEDHTYALNKETTDKDVTWEIIDEETNTKNEHISDWKFETGQIIKMRVFNDPLSPHPMQHPFHMHGQRMMTISINGEEVENKVWKDTILVPVGDTFDIIVEMSNPGIWMAHCHIAEHLSAGMMFNFAVGREYFDQYDEIQMSGHSM